MAGICWRRLEKSTMSGEVDKAKMKRIKRYKEGILD
jgi:hypothetical protein